MLVKEISFVCYKNYKKPLIQKHKNQNTKPGITNLKVGGTYSSH